MPVQVQKVMGFASLYPSYEVAMTEA